MAPTYRADPEGENEADAVNQEPQTFRCAGVHGSNSYFLSLVAAGAFVLLLVGATAVSSWQAVRATRAERTALGLQQREVRLRRQAELVQINAARALVGDQWKSAELEARAEASLTGIRLDPKLFPNGP